MNSIITLYIQYIDLRSPSYRCDICQARQEHEEADAEGHLGLVPLRPLVAHYRYDATCEAGYGA